nr:xylulose kinase-1 [Tanacetum cinerariifolium]
MALTFTDTHNMIAFLTKSDASEGFNQIIDFLNASSIKYALTVNPNIYVSIIKQFWSSITVKKVNGVSRLQAVVNRKKVIITEATIRDALCLDDAEGIDCLPNEEIFTELARMGAKRMSWNEFSSSMASIVICLSTGRKFNFSKYIFDSLVRKRVFWSRNTIFEGMIVAQQVGEGAAEVVSTAGVTTEDIPSTSQVQPTPSPSLIAQPPSPQHQPQPSRDAGISMDLLQNLLDTYTTFTRRVEHLEQDKTAQALEITKLKHRVKKLERRNKLKASKLRRLKKVGTTQKVKTFDDTVMDDVSKQGRIIAYMDADKDVTLKDVAAVAKDVQDAKIKESSDVLGRQAESQAQIYQIDLEHADKVLSMPDVDIEPNELQEVLEVVTTAMLLTEVVTAASTTITVAIP